MTEGLPEKTPGDINAARSVYRTDSEVRVNVSSVAPERCEMIAPRSGLAAAVFPARASVDYWHARELAKRC